MGLTFLDSCMVIHADEQSPRGDAMRQRLASIDFGRLAVSPLVRLEALVRPIRENDQSRIASRESLLGRCVQLPINEDAYSLATHLRARLGLGTADAVHVATASVNGCAALWTSDRQLLRAAPGFAVDVLSEA